VRKTVGSVIANNELYISVHISCTRQRKLLPYIPQWLFMSLLCKITPSCAYNILLMYN